MSLQSSTHVTVEQQLIHEDPIPSLESPVSHTPEGQKMPEPSVANCGSGEPGPVDGQQGSPPPKTPRNHWLLKVYTSDLEYRAHDKQTGPGHLEPKEAEHKGEKSSTHVTVEQQQIDEDSMPSLETLSSTHVTVEQQQIDEDSMPSLETLSSTQVTVEQQQIDEDSMPSLESSVSHKTEGQKMPELSVANCGSGEPGPVDGQQGSPPPKPPRIHWLLQMYTSDLEYRAHDKQTGPGHLEPKEAEHKAAAQEAEAAPVKRKVQTEEQVAGLEASPPPAASPGAAEEPGPAPDQTDAPPTLTEEPSLEPVLIHASEQELPVEGPAPGPLVEYACYVPRKKKSSTHVTVEQQQIDEDSMPSLETLSSTHVTVEQQQIDEDSMPSLETLVSHKTEGQKTPELSVANCGSGEPGPVDGQQGTPPPKLPRIHSDTLIPP
uniref:Uncharacterized protein n=1 Tax=Myotis myotis TaxID=51298 RepID=A0A7J7UPM6_MYOMY|nr:hypothetical protein mMyoMyo1_008645 [Myotis myotis]